MQFNSESLPWVDSLTLCDPLVFPLVFLTANVVNIRLNTLIKKAGPQTKLQKAMPWIFGTGIAAISVLACYVPSVSCPRIICTSFVIPLYCSCVSMIPCILLLS
jgi:hypothetical protein